MTFTQSPWLGTALAAAVILFALAIVVAIARHAKRRRPDDPTDYEGA